MALAIIKRIHFNRIAPRRAYNLNHLVVKRAARVGIGVDKARIHKQALVLVL